MSWDELETGTVSDDVAREVRARLSAIRRGLERIRTAGERAVRRTRLALGGREVMEILEVGPGPEVGRALRYLTEQVEADPDCNSEDGLRALLRGWKDLGH